MSSFFPTFFRSRILLPRRVCLLIPLSQGVFFLHSTFLFFFSFPPLLGHTTKNPPNANVPPEPARFLSPFIRQLQISPCPKSPDLSLPFNIPPVVVLLTIVPAFLFCVLFFHPLESLPLLIPYLFGTGPVSLLIAIGSFLRLYYP